MLVCILFCANRTRDRGCSAHPVFPAPSVFESGKFPAKLGRIAPREGGFMSFNVIASEAKQSISPRKERLDCFAELVIGRHFAPTRWFSMTWIGRGVLGPALSRR